jgi:hypothetical protein
MDASEDFRQESGQIGEGVNQPHVTVAVCLAAETTFIGTGTVAAVCR